MSMITANGKRRTIHPGTSVGDLLADLKLAPMQVFIEYNGEPLERQLFSITHLEDGDNLEIAQMVGGG